MSKNNRRHTNYRANFNETVEHAKPAVASDEETVTEPVAPPVVVNPVVTTPVVSEPEPKIVTGIVKGCKLLNVRKEPNVSSSVVATLGCNSEVAIDLDNSADDFYKIFATVGAEGFCMKKFVELSKQ